MEISDIKSPADIKSLSVTDLKIMARDIRQILLTKLSQTGGHVGPNLGMVEATLALHYVFKTPADQLVFDVSHQTYIHKILTGRVKSFLDPNSYKDTTGYTNPKESVYDLFNIGHTSTSVALAVGLAKARDLKGEKFNVVSVIGDGSLSGGEAFEGLDIGATLGSNFIVIVNDNQMSIAPNHGGLYADLRLLRHTNGEADNNYFRSLGYAYRYVKDGNNVEALIKAFNEVKDLDVPVVVHINTEKGLGYKPAEIEKERFHYSGPFDLDTGVGQPDDSIDYGDVTAEYLLGRLKRDKKLVIVNAGTPGAIGFDAERRRKAGRHFMDVGIAEEAAASICSGLAKNGMNTYWGVVSSFVQRAYDQIAQDIALNKTPVVIGVFYGTAAGMTDATHLGWFDESLLSNIPDLLYLAPTCKSEYLAMLEWSLNQKDYPVVLRTPGVLANDLDIDVDNTYDDINTYRVVRSGHGLAIIAAGSMLANTLKAADILEREGKHITVINPRFLNAVDEEMLSSLSPDHHSVLTVEDAIIDGGMGQKIASFYGDRPMLVKNLGLEKRFADRYRPADLLKKAYMDPEGIAEMARRMFK